MDFYQTKTTETVVYSISIAQIIGRNWRTLVQEKHL